MKHSFKDWLFATRPWSFPASSMPVLVTVAWSWSRGCDVNWLFALWALVNIIFVHAAIIGGLLLVWLTGITLLYIGVAGILLSLLYPRLKYAALGDLVIIFCYSLLPMAGTSFIISGAIHWDVLWLAVPVGLITVGILHANNVRDITTDRRAGIHTFPLFTGHRFGAWLYAFEVIFPYLWLVALMIFRLEPWWLGVAFLSMPIAVRNARTMLTYQPGQSSTAFASLDEKTAQLQLLFSLLLILGLALSKFL